MAAEGAALVTARCRIRLTAPDLGHDQVEYLGRAHIQGALLEEVCQRIRRVIGGHLQDALIDGEYHDPRRLFSGVSNAQGVTRLDEVRYLQVDCIAPRVEVHREGLHSVRE